MQRSTYIFLYLLHLLNFSKSGRGEEKWSFCCDKEYGEAFFQLWLNQFEICMQFCLCDSWYIYEPIVCNGNAHLQNLGSVKTEVSRLNISAVWKRSLIISNVLILPAVLSVDVCLFLYTSSCDYFPLASLVKLFPCTFSPLHYRCFTS